MSERDRALLDVILSDDPTMTVEQKQEAQAEFLSRVNERVEVAKALPPEESPDASAVWADVMLRAMANPDRRVFDSMAQEAYREAVAADEGTPAFEDWIEGFVGQLITESEGRAARH